jgi:hypothetical protein
MADIGAEGSAPEHGGHAGFDGETPSEADFAAGAADQTPPVAGSAFWDDIVQEFPAADAAGSAAGDVGDDQHGPWWGGIEAFDYQAGAWDAGVDDRSDVPSFAEGPVADWLDELETCVTAQTDGAHHAVTEAVSSFFADLHAKLGAAQDQAV